MFVPNQKTNNDPTRCRCRFSRVLLTTDSPQREEDIDLERIGVKRPLQALISGGEGARPHHWKAPFSEMKYGWGYHLLVQNEQSTPFVNLQGIGNAGALEKKPPFVPKVYGTLYYEGLDGFNHPRWQLIGALKSHCNQGARVIPAYQPPWSVWHFDYPELPAGLRFNGVSIRSVSEAIGKDVMGSPFLQLRVPDTKKGRVSLLRELDMFTYFELTVAADLPSIPFCRDPLSWQATVYCKNIVRPIEFFGPQPASSQAMSACLCLDAVKRVFRWLSRGRLDATVRLTGKVSPFQRGFRTFLGWEGLGATPSGLIPSADKWPGGRLVDSVLDGRDFVRGMRRELTFIGLESFASGSLSRPLVRSGVPFYALTLISAGPLSWGVQVPREGLKEIAFQFPKRKEKLSVAHLTRRSTLPGRDQKWCDSMRKQLSLCRLGRATLDRLLKLTTLEVVGPPLPPSVTLLLLAFIGSKCGLLDVFGGKCKISGIRLLTDERGFRGLEVIAKRPEVTATYQHPSERWGRGIDEDASRLLDELALGFKVKEVMPWNYHFGGPSERGKKVAEIAKRKLRELLSSVLRFYSWVGERGYANTNKIIFEGVPSTPPFSSEIPAMTPEEYAFFRRHVDVRLQTSEGSASNFWRHWVGALRFVSGYSKPLLKCPELLGVVVIDLGDPTLLGLYHSLPLWAYESPRGSHAQRARATDRIRCVIPCGDDHPYDYHCGFHRRDSESLRNHEQGTPREIPVSERFEVDPTDLTACTNRWVVGQVSRKPLRRFHWLGRSRFGGDSLFDIETVLEAHPTDNLVPRAVRLSRSALLSLCLGGGATRRLVSAFGGELHNGLRVWLEGDPNPLALAFVLAFFGADDGPLEIYRDCEVTGLYLFSDPSLGDIRKIRIFLKNLRPTSTAIHRSGEHIHLDSEPLGKRKVPDIPVKALSSESHLCFAEASLSGEGILKYLSCFKEILFIAANASASQVLVGVLRAFTKKPLVRNWINALVVYLDSYVEGFCQPGNSPEDDLSGIVRITIPHDRDRQIGSGRGATAQLYSSLRSGGWDDRWGFQLTCKSPSHASVGGGSPLLPARRCDYGYNLLFRGACCPPGFLRSRRRWFLPAERCRIPFYKIGSTLRPLGRTPRGFGKGVIKIPEGLVLVSIPPSSVGRYADRQLIFFLRRGTDSVLRAMVLPKGVYCRLESRSNQGNSGRGLGVESRTGFFRLSQRLKDLRRNTKYSLVDLASLVSTEGLSNCNAREVTRELWCLLDLLKGRGKRGSRPPTSDLRFWASSLSKEGIRFVRKKSGKTSSREAGLQGTVWKHARTEIEGSRSRTRLVLRGVGYRVRESGKDAILLSLGYSHPLLVLIPRGLTVSLGGPTTIDIEGRDKGLVGRFAACVRGLRPPDGYKGKGVFYEEEPIKTRDGKSGKK
jgi:large subunit ribosomal protein L6